MKRLEELFKIKEGNILSIFTTAGYPNIDSTVKTVLDLAKSGVDLIELGIPFSDPMADGPTIQESSEVAIENGMTLNLMFKQVKEIRKSSSIPIIMMGYMNPIFQFGVKEFLEECKKCKIDGLIIPDISVEIYLKDYKTVFEQFEIPMIFLITPNTSLSRIKKIDELSNSFIYLVSTSSVTGKAGEFSQEQIEDFRRISDYTISSPILVGFGIHNAKTFKTVCNYFQGAIIGSEFIRSQRGNVEVSNFVKEIKNSKDLFLE